MNTIHLHGQIGRDYGAIHELEVASPREALRALLLTLDGLADQIKEGTWRVVRGSQVAGAHLDEKMLDVALGEEDLHIIPAIRGEGGNGAGKIIVGVVMVAAAFFTGGATLAAWGAMATGMAVMGGALIMGGIAQMSAQMPATDVDQRAKDNQESFLFDGPVNVTAQGGPVNLVYGEMIVGSTVISSGLTAEDIPIDEDSTDIESAIKGTWNG